MRKCARKVSINYIICMNSEEKVRENRLTCLCVSFSGEVSGENVSASTGSRGGDRGEAADLGTHTENNDGATLAANTAIDARGGSPQGAHLSGAATPRPPRSRRRQNQNGLDTTQVSVVSSRKRRAASSSSP